MTRRILGVGVLALVLAGLVVPGVKHLAAQSLIAIDVTPASPSINAGQTQPFTAQGTFSDG